MQQIKGWERSSLWLHSLSAAKNALLTFGLLEDAISVEDAIAQLKMDGSKELAELAVKDLEILQMVCGSMSGEISRENLERAKEALKRDDPED